MPKNIVYVRNVVLTVKVKLGAALMALMNGVFTALTGSGGNVVCARESLVVLEKLPPSPS